MSAKCGVVGCGKPISQETFCAEHYPMFKGSAQAHNAATASMFKAIEEAKAARAKAAAAALAAKGGSAAGAGAADGKAAAGGGGASAPPADTKQLQERLRNVWRGAKRVVCKDLPRLAKRTNISEPARGAIVAMGVPVAATEQSTEPAAKHPYQQVVPDGSGLTATAPAGDKKTDPIFGKTPHFFDATAKPAAQPAAAGAAAPPPTAAAGSDDKSDAPPRPPRPAPDQAAAAAAELAARLIPLEISAAAAATPAASAAGKSPVISPVGSPGASPPVSPPMNARSIAGAAGGDAAAAAAAAAKAAATAASNLKIWGSIETVVRALSLQLESGPADDKLAAAKPAAATGTAAAAAGAAGDAKSAPVALPVTKREQIELGLSRIGAQISAAPSAVIDFEALIDTLMKQYVGYDSRVGRVLRICHQSVIFPALAFLQSKLFSQLGPMKDVRSDDGWQINIHTGLGAVYVTHVRWEQSIMAAPDAFSIRWELQCSFDKELNDLRAVFVRVLDTKFCDNVTPATREKVSNIARGNGYIIS